MSDNPFSNLQEFQKIWTETLSKLSSASMSVGTGAPPNEAARAMRDGMFQAMSQMWEQYLRSDEFLQMSKQTMDNAVAFRKLSNEFFNKCQQTTEGASRSDVQELIRCVRAMDGSISRKLESIESRLNALETRTREPNRAASPRAGRKSTSK